jgi:hypothetical protein
MTDVERAEERDGANSGTRDSESLTERHFAVREEPKGRREGSGSRLDIYSPLARRHRVSLRKEP